MGNIESKVRSAAEVLMRFFGATFFLEVEGAVTSVVQGSYLFDRFRNITHGSCVLAMGRAHCPGNHQVGRRPLASSEPG